MIDPRQFVESFSRGFKLLSIVCKSASPLSLLELAKESHLSVSTIQRLSYTLQHLGLVDRDPETKKFKVGPEMISLAFTVIDNLTLKKIAYPHMQRLSEALDEVVALAVLSGAQVILVESIKTQQILNVNISGGVSIPLHATASGKAMLAFLPDPKAEPILKQIDFNRFTDTTTTSLSALKTVLRKVKKSGFAIAVDENIPGLGAVAAPIRGNDGEVIAALTVLVPTARVTRDKLVDEYSDRVIQTAESISFDMGYRKKTGKR